MEDIFLLLGGNLGDRKKYLQEAVRLINEQIGQVEICSSYYETEAWGKSGQPHFLNQVIRLKSSASSMKLLELIWSIEISLGRIREEKWGARTIDIDILFYGSQVVNLPDLIIPHKLLHERRFALMPLCEIAPNMEHPLLKKPLKQLLLELTDNLSVKKLEYNV